MTKDTLLVIPKKNLEELDEAYSLAKTAGYSIKSVIVTRYRKSKIIKKGKLDEIKHQVEMNNLNTIIFYDEFTPEIYYKLYKATRISSIIDKPLLILEIFYQHAGTNEAKLQIELARIRHEIPIVREFIRRQKMGELPGFLGPGKYAVDKYLLLLRSREHTILKKIRRLKERKKNEIERRKREGLPHVVITGYTCAGKTSLFNALTSSKRSVGEEYFTTITPKTKGAVVYNGMRVIVTDTVGFIRSIPPYIIEAFYATLQEIVYSDLAILVIDISEPRKDIMGKLSESFKIMEEIGAKSIPVLLALNKVDLVRKDVLQATISMIKDVVSSHNNIFDIIPISAERDIGIEEVRKTIWSFFRRA